MQREKKSIVTLLSTVYSHAKHLIIFSSPIWRLRWTPLTEIWPRRSLSWGLSCGPSQCRTSSPNMPRLRGRSSSSQKSERNFVSCDCVPFFVFLEFLKRWKKSPHQCQQKDTNGIYWAIYKNHDFYWIAPWHN